MIKRKMFREGYQGSVDQQSDSPSETLIEELMLTSHLMIPHFKSKVFDHMQKFVDWFKKEEKHEKELKKLEQQKKEEENRLKKLQKAEEKRKEEEAKRAAKLEKKAKAKLLKE